MMFRSLNAIVLDRYSAGSIRFWSSGLFNLFTVFRNHFQAFETASDISRKRTGSQTLDDGCFRNVGRTNACYFCDLEN